MPNWTLSAILVLAGIAADALALRTRHPSPQREGEDVITYGPRARFAASAALALPFFAAALVAHRVSWSDRSARFWMLLSASSLALLLLWLVRVEVVGLCHRVTKEELVGGDMFRKAVRIPWPKVSSVRFSPLNQWFEIEGEACATVRISLWLCGISELARALDENGVLQSARVQPHARARLAAYEQRAVNEPQGPQSMTGGGRP